MLLIARRELFLAAAAAAATAAAARAQDLPAHERELHEAARREGEVTWYSGQYSAET